jgi:hypothetical protein
MASPGGTAFLGGAAFLGGSHPGFGVTPRPGRFFWIIFDFFAKTLDLSIK